MPRTVIINSAKKDLPAEPGRGSKRAPEAETPEARPKAKAKAVLCKAKAKAKGKAQAKRS